MTDRQPYTFIALRYVHDVVTGEFVNVGVLVHASKSGQGYGRFRTSMGRVKMAFPALDRAAFVSAMKSVLQGLRAYQKLPKAELLPISADAAAFARMIIPSDDSALQWSSVGAGFAEDMKDAVDRLYERLVTRNDLRVDHRSRSDEDVWRPVRERLEQRNIPIHLGEKVISGSTDHIVLKHAWKNGAWHAYEPISFDLADAEGIKEKARRWRGHLEAVSDGATEPLVLSLIIGAPDNDELKPAYENAIRILEKAPFQPRLYPETKVEELIDSIEDEVRFHRANLMRSANQGQKPK